MYIQLSCELFIVREINNSHKSSVFWFVAETRCVQTGNYKFKRCKSTCHHWRISEFRNLERILTNLGQNINLGQNLDKFRSKYQYDMKKCFPTISPLFGSHHLHPPRQFALVTHFPDSNFGQNSLEPITFDTFIS